MSGDSVIFLAVEASCVVCPLVVLFMLLRGSSGVEPCRRIEWRDRSLELARLRALCFSCSVASDDTCNLWDDLDAMRLEKKDLEGSRECCLGDARSGEEGSSGMAVIVEGCCAL